MLIFNSTNSNFWVKFGWWTIFLVCFESFSLCCFIFHCYYCWSCVCFCCVFIFPFRLYFISHRRAFYFLEQTERDFRYNWGRTRKKACEQAKHMNMHKQKYAHTHIHQRKKMRKRMRRRWGRVFTGYVQHWERKKKIGANSFNRSLAPSIETNAECMSNRIVGKCDARAESGRGRGRKNHKENITNARTHTHIAFYRISTPPCVHPICI